MTFKSAVICVALAMAAPAFSEQVQVTRGQLLSLGVEALSTGDAADARKAVQIADALLKKNPKDLDAHALRARALAQLGNAQEARRSAGVIFQNSETPSSKHGAALLTSKALFSEKDYPAAQIWLRRAIQYAETDAQRAEIRQLYGAVKKANPFSASFSLSASPNSNINNGSFEDTLLFNFAGVEIPLQLSVDAKALAGYSADASMRLSYRLAQGQNFATSLKLDAYGRMNWLSSGSKQAIAEAAADETDPAAAAELMAIKGSDFNYYTTALSLEHVQKLGASGITAIGSVTGGRVWYGGSKLNDFVGGNLTFTAKTAGGRGTPALTLQLKRNFGAANGDAPVSIASLRASYGHKLPWGDTVIGHGSYTRTFSTSATQVYSMPEVGLTYRLGKPIAGVNLSFGATYGYRTYDVASFSANGRQDHRLAGFVEAEVRSLSYMGFTPVVKVQAQRNSSNINIYSNQSVSGGLYFKSSF
ncbi:MAG: hypothetical protein ACRBCL_00890 [Maritimibacter sp.]